ATTGSAQRQQTITRSLATSSLKKTMVYYARNRWDVLTLGGPTIVGTVGQVHCLLSDLAR
ncbi:MAG: hypothetical protein WA196_09195, partial [Pseudolabrys sp.]